MSSSSNRLILAAMTRECSICFDRAAKGGKWAPDFKAISNMLTLWTYEMILVCPVQLLFSIMAHWYVIYPSELISPIQLDLKEKRKSNCDYHLSELVKIGDRYNYSMATCKAVLNNIENLESVYLNNNSNNNSKSDILDQINVLKNVEAAAFYDNNGVLKQNDSKMEFRVYILRGFTITSFLALFIWLFFHDM
jgi:hypothetical protein